MSCAYALFLAGEVYGRDNVRWYSPRFVGEEERFYRAYHNVGDSVVFDSTLKILGFDKIIPIDFNNPDPATVERIKSECQFGILRGSNYFHPEMKWGKLVEFIKTIGLPLVVCGVGVQSALANSDGMGAQSEYVARALADHCVSIGVRGARSAEMFADIGVKNTRIVGCPSMFRSLRETWVMAQDRVNRLPQAPNRSIPSSITLRREIGPDYVSDVRNYLNIEKKFIQDADVSSRMTLFAQGELFEKYMFHGRVDLLKTEIMEPVRQGWIEGSDDPILEIYSRCLFYSSDVSKFCSTLGQGYFVTGFRVHGVLPALAVGIPGCLINYDTRTNELIETFDIPSISIQECSFRTAYDRLRSYDYQRMTIKYAQIRQETLQYLDENKIPERLRSAGKPI